MISWGAARTIAVTLASRTERAPAGDFDYPAAVEETLRPLSDFAGIELPPGTDTARRLVVSRPLAAFRTLAPAVGGR